MKIKINNGDMTINIYDMLEELFREAEPEEVEELYHTLGWFHPAYKELIDTARDTWVGTNYNSKFFKLFKDFFMLPARWFSQGPEKDVLHRMTQAMEAILEENATLRVENWRNNSLALDMRDWIKFRLQYIIRAEDLDDIVRDTYNKVHEFQSKGKENASAMELSREIVKNTEYKDFVRIWVDKVQEMLRAISCPECGSDDIHEFSIAPGDLVCLGCDHRFTKE